METIDQYKYLGQKTIHSKTNQYTKIDERIGLTWAANVELKYIFEMKNVCHIIQFQQILLYAILSVSYFASIFLISSCYHKVSDVVCHLLHFLL